MQVLIKTDLFYGLEQILLVSCVGRNASVATKLERGHEHTHGVLIVFGETVFVIMQHLVQVERQLWSMLSR